MKKIIRHKFYIRDMRQVSLTDTQYTKLFYFIGLLLNDLPLPPESKDHKLQGEWKNFRELHLGGDMLLIYLIDADTLYLTRLGSHNQLFKSM